MDERIGRDLRRYQLAMRLVAHGARTQTLVDLTGLSRHRLATLRHRWMVRPETRHRGPSPSSFASFFRSPRARSESSSLAVLCHILRSPQPKDDCVQRRGDQRLTRGEQLCEIYEAYRACLPQSEIEFEQVVLLANGLSRGELIRMGACERCHCAVLIDCLAHPRRLCSHCQRHDVTADS